MTALGQQSAAGVGTSGMQSGLMLLLIYLVKLVLQGLVAALGDWSSSKWAVQSIVNAWRYVCL
jgi:hypothetical protein